MENLIVFMPGDRVRYHGMAVAAGEIVITAGDEGTVVQGNLDLDDDVLVRWEAYDITANGFVSPEALEWLGGRA